MSALEFFTGFITISDDPVRNWILGAILLSTSGSVAYAIGGRLDYHGKSGFYLWLITAVVVYAAIACVIRAVLWLIALSWWIWAIVGGVVLAASVAVIAVVLKKKVGKRNES